MMFHYYTSIFYISEVVSSVVSSMTVFLRITSLASTDIINFKLNFILLSILATLEYHASEWYQSMKNA